MGNENYTTRKPTEAADLPDILPIFPLAGVILLPRARLPLNVFEPRYLHMVEEALANKRLVGMIQPKAEPDADPVNPPLFNVGCAGRIHSFNETEDGRLLISMIGVCRFRVAEELELKKGFRRVKADWSPYFADLAPTSPCPIDRSGLLERLHAFFDLHDIAGEWDVLEKTDGNKLISSLSMICPFSPCEKQALLEAETSAKRCTLLTQLMDMSQLEDDTEHSVKH